MPAPAGLLYCHFQLMVYTVVLVLKPQSPLKSRLADRVNILVGPMSMLMSMLITVFRGPLPPYAHPLPPPPTNTKQIVFAVGRAMNKSWLCTP